MQLLSWNVQWCRGMDGRVDPERIAASARALCDPDLLCLQEVADRYAPLAGNDDSDQVARLAALFPGYSAHYAWGVDVPDGAGGRRRFGNLILSRLPVQRVLRHALPWPADPATPSMPRVALEAEIAVPWGALRLTTTHLEYYSPVQRAAQVEALRAYHAEAVAHARTPGAGRDDGGPFSALPRPAAAIVTGDFNLPAGDALHARMQAPFDDGTAAFVDAWTCAHPQTPHPPSFRLHDPAHAGAPYCCDFVFLSEDLAPRVREVRIDLDCRASDHQPVLVRFA